MGPSVSGVEDLGPVPFFDGSDRLIRRIHSPLYGDLWAPDDHAQLGIVLDFIASQFDAIGWRGQADIRWKLDCTAVRRLLRAQIEGGGPEASADGVTAVDRHSPALRRVLEEYEQGLLDDARRGGHDRLKGRRLSNFELLATLQHHGAATRFLDFTRNLFVALWFASSPFLDTWGIVLGLRRMTDGPVEITGSDVEAASPDDLFLDHPDRLLVWRPAPLVPRITAQQSVLVCSPVGDYRWGSFGIAYTGEDPDIDVVYAGRLGAVGRDIVDIAVSPTLKYALRQGGGDILGYDPATMFPDLDGFCRWHAPEAPLDPEMYRRLVGL